MLLFSFLGLISASLFKQRLDDHAYSPGGGGVLPC